MRQGGRQSLLIVDDASENLDIVASCFKGKYRVQVATCGEKALEIARGYPPPDLILLDVLMPDLDGYEVLRLLKADCRTADIPVVFLTVKDALDDIIKGFEVGAVDYVPKPFNVLELERRVDAHMTIKRQRDMLMKRNAEYRELVHILCHDLNNSFSMVKLALDSIEVCDDCAIELERHRISMKVAIDNGIDMIELVRGMCRAETYRVELSAINLCEVLSEAELILGDIYEKKSVELHCDIPKDIEVLAEKTSLLNSVVMNLLTNAVKFSKRGGRVDVSAKRTPEGGVVLVVKDEGIGIPKKMAGKVFDISATRSRIGTEGEPGTGFGLPMVDKFVRIYGGWIELESKDEAEFPEEHGTVVRVGLKSASRC